MPDAKSVELGRLASRIALLRLGRTGLKFAAQHERELIGAGWLPSQTVRLRQLWRELADSMDDDDPSEDTESRSLEDSAVIAESQAFVQHLQEALRQLFLFGGQSGLTLPDFSFQGYPLQTRQGLIRYFEDIRPKIACIESSLKRWFRSLGAVEQLEIALEHLSRLHPPPEDSEDLPGAETMRVLGIKGNLLELLRELEHAAGSVSSESDSVLAGLSTARLLTEADGHGNVGPVSEDLPQQLV